MRSAKTRGLGVGAQEHCRTLNGDAEGSRAALEFSGDAMGGVGTHGDAEGSRGGRNAHSMHATGTGTGQVRSGRDGTEVLADGTARADDGVFMQSIDNRVESLRRL